MIEYLNIAKEAVILARKKFDLNKDRVVVNSSIGKDIKLQLDIDIEKTLIKNLKSNSDFDILGEESGLIKGSSDKKFRLTLDNKMSFYAVNPIRDYFKIFSDEEKTVVELKYNHQYADGARFITEHFPFRLTKNSKYVIGVERIRNWK